MHFVSKFRADIKKVRGNCFLVLDSRSAELVLTLMGAQFTSISLRSLEKSLSRLNGVDEKIDPR